MLTDSIKTDARHTDESRKIHHQTVRITANSDRIKRISKTHTDISRSDGADHNKDTEQHKHSEVTYSADKEDHSLH